MKTSNRFSVKISAIAASIMLANAAIGQEGGSGVEGLEEIIVTVQKKKKSGFKNAGGSNRHFQKGYRARARYIACRLAA